MERPISTQALEQIKSALFDGNKIAAIKIYREDTGSTLAEAKAAVEKVEAEWRVMAPEKFRATARKGGCGGCLVLLIVLGGLALFLLLLLLRRS